MCPFCNRDPFEYVDVGVGFVPVAVNCCEYGYALYELGMSEIYLRNQRNSMLFLWGMQAKKGYVQLEYDKIPF